MRVALVQAPVWWTLDPPLGLAQIAGCARAAGHEVDVYDVNMLLWKGRGARYENLWLWEQFQFWNQPEFVARFMEEHRAVVDEQLERLLRSDAKVIGFSVGLGSQWASLELVRRIKLEDPSRIIVWGGQFFFMGDTAREWLAHPEIDAVVRGHGDEVFPRLLREVAAGGIVPGPGVVCRAGGAIVDGGPAERPALDGVPFAELSRFPLELYTDPIRIPFAASRGCVWKCHFCSSTQFWSGYTYMSGERIFAEVMHHRRELPGHKHVEFYDITANGDVKALHRFAELAGDAIQDPARFIGWKINAILRPEMTPEVLRELHRANCHDIIYGIESGSPAVLERMNKPFQIPVAEKVLKDTHDAGIIVTGNFMFGYPGETEADFDLTLDFVRRNAASLDRVYASATFTSLEEGSHLTGHRAEFGLRDLGHDRFHHLYWESADGTNDYEVRLDRYRRFRRVAIGLGVDAYKGVNGQLEQDHLANLAHYKEFRSDHLAAVDHYLSYLEGDLYSEPMRARMEEYARDLGSLWSAQRSVEKANGLLRREAALAEPFAAWASPHLNNGGLPASAERPAWWAEAARFLERARTHLLKLSQERRAGVHWKGDHFALVWIERELPSSAELRLAWTRARRTLELAAAEIGRGEHQQEAPRCQR